MRSCYSDRGWMRHVLFPYDLLTLVESLVGQGEDNPQLGATYFSCACALKSGAAHAHTVNPRTHYG